MTADVLKFPSRTCRLCEHFKPYYPEIGDPLGPSGYCQMLDKRIYDVHEVASRCNAYEEVGRSGKPQ